MSVKNLSGKPLEVAQELLKLPRESRNAVLEAVSLESAGYPRPRTLCEYSPALIWSRRPVEITTYFFCEPVGYRGQDWSHTNMTVGGMLCYPVSFKRDEIRLYAGTPDDALRLTEIIRGVQEPMSFGGVRERRGQSDVHMLNRDVRVAHVSLPTPEHPVQRQDAKALLETVNGGKLPCAVWKAPHNIAATECFLLEADLAMPMEKFSGMELIAVYVGTLVAPPPSDMARA
ncbi:MAG: hypothetical protein ACRDGM_06615 [bacterium]